MAHPNKKREDLLRFECYGCVHLRGSPMTGSYCFMKERPGRENQEEEWCQKYSPVSKIVDQQMRADWEERREE